MQGLCGSNISSKNLWSINQAIMDKRGVSSTTAADDIDDGVYNRTQRSLLPKWSMMIIIGKVVIMKEIRMGFT